MRHAYSALFVLALPLIVLRLLWRSRRAPAYRQRLGERLGVFDVARDGRPLLWIHAVSLGETIAARPLIERLLAARADYQLLVTTTTPTGSAQVRRFFGDRVLHVYAPWDTPGSVRRFFARCAPSALVLMETELWPNMLHRCARTGCRVLLANARLSERSAAGYARFAGTTRAMLDSLEAIAAQSEADARRFADLGMDRARIEVTGSVKFDVRLDDGIRKQAAGLKQRWGLGARPVFVVASTHEREDELALEAFALLRERLPEALMLLAPRHPERFDEVYALCREAGLKVARRSQGRDPGADTSLVLVDTLGELLMFYGVADVAVIGGSFVASGGHNPLEAAVWGVPVLAGRSMFNFADVTRRLLAAGALEQVDGARALATGLANLLQDDEERSRRGSAALKVMAENRGALDAVADAVGRML